MRLPPPHLQEANKMQTVKGLAKELAEHDEA